jgi:hypothetical protein
VLPLLLLAACATTETPRMLAPADIDRCTHGDAAAPSEPSAGLALVHETLELGPDA